MLQPKVIAIEKYISVVPNISIPRLLRTRKYLENYPHSASFKHIATTLIESYEIKILISLSSPMLNNHLRRLNFNLFFRSPGLIPMNSIFAVRPFPLLKKRQFNKEKHKRFFESNIFPGYIVTARARSDQSSYESAAHGNGFHNQLSGSNTQREESTQKISNKSSASIFANFFLNPSLKCFNSVIANYEHLVYERSCVQLGYGKYEQRAKRV